jgi:hypothetical protein
MQDLVMIHKGQLVPVNNNEFKTLEANRSWNLLDHHHLCRSETEQIQEKIINGKLEGIKYQHYQECNDR